MTLPTGPAITFLFTDIEGSTRLERAVGTSDWARIVGRHDELVRRAIEGAGGVVVKTEGDAFFAAFAAPADAVSAAASAQRSIAAEPWPQLDTPLRVRMGLHLGEGRLRHGRTAGEPEDYVGIDVNYAARIAGAANGGQIVASDVLIGALGSPGAPGVDAVADEGLRSVKDFEEPLRLHRLVVAGAADDTRPLRTLEAPTNLPGDVTALVGRADEVAAVGGLLEGGRIVTLTGPGGSGKTRLALGVASGIRDRFPHGTWFVDLAAVRDPSLLEPAIGSAIGLKESPDRSMPEVVREHLRTRTCLLVLDNLEQLLPDAARQVAELARLAPEVRFLVTSRELLRIGGERNYPVPPLATEAGMNLFEARAIAVRPDIVLADVDRIAIRKICERVQGLPLAIELAAARVRLLSPALILDRLASSLDLGAGGRDMPERQRTLRGAITWSHDLLSEPEQRLFRRLAVFAGGWTAELAMAVVDPDGTLGMELLEGLESLADKSLVRIEPASAEATEPRFDMHPLLREYATERLDEAGERATAEAGHANAIAAFAESVGPSILSATGAGIIRRLDREQHNIRDALRWAHAANAPEVGLRVMGAVWRWFQQRGRIREARAELADLLGHEIGEPTLRIGALAAEGGLAYWAGDTGAARAAYADRLALAEATGDPVLIADANYDIGFVDMIEGDPDGLRRHEQLALDLYASTGRADGATRARQALVLGVFQSGDLARALELESQNLAEFRTNGSDYQIADSSTLHSAIYFSLGDPVSAWEWMLEGLRMFAVNENPSGIVRGVGMAAIILLGFGDPEAGALVAGSTYELIREKGLMLAPVKVLHLPDPEATAIERLGAARARALLEEGATIPSSEMVELLLATPTPDAITLRPGAPSRPPSG